MSQWLTISRAAHLLGISRVALQKRIREDAFARRLRERVLPTQETLAQRIFVQGQELAELQRTLTRYHTLLETLRSRLNWSYGADN